MGILSRYILQEYAKYCALISGVLLPVAFMLRLLEKGRKADAGQWLPLLRSFLYNLPAFLVDLFPFVMLLATWVTLAVFRRHGEWTAFLGTGASPVRLAAPLLAVGLAVSLLFFSLNATLVPDGLKRAREIDHPKRGDRASLVENETWFLSDPRTLWSVRMFDVETGQMYGVHLFRFTPDFSLMEEAEAKRLIRKNGPGNTGLLVEGVQRTFEPDGSVRVETFMEKEVGPLRNNFGQLEIKPKEMTSRQLQRYILEMSDAGFNVRRHAIELEARRAFPFANFLLVLLTVALAARQTSLPWVLALGLGFGIGYGPLFSAALSLGRSGVVPAWLAAWSANALYLVIALALLPHAPRQPKPIS